MEDSEREKFELLPEDLEDFMEDKERSEHQIVMLPIGSLMPHKDNPRKDVGDLTELVQSIKESGIMQNLTVVPAVGRLFAKEKYTVIIGHRRLAAARIAGLTEVPCAIVEMTPEKQVATMLAENMQRVDLTPLEQADGIQLMLDFGETVESIAQKTGISQSTVRRRKKLTEYDRENLSAALNKGATLADLAELQEIEDPTERDACLARFGDSDFRWIVNNAKSRQESNKKKEHWREILRESGVEFISEEESSGRNFYFSIYFYEANFETYLEKIKEQSLCCVEYGSRLGFFGEEKSEEDHTEENRKAEELAEQRRSRKKQVLELTKIAYKTRLDFVRCVTEKNCEDILSVLVTVTVASSFVRLPHGYDETGRLKDYTGYSLGAEGTTIRRYSGIKEWFAEKTGRSPAKTLFLYLMANLDPGEEYGYFEQYASDACWQESIALNEVYRILKMLGYQMSEDEKQLQNGSHAVFAKEGEK